MQELLREHEVGPRFRARKRDASEVTIAVPFWGEGAIKMLGLGRQQNARIICNLTSTACNPYVIEALKKKKGIDVWSHPRLHAKVYATSKFVIIGSSNASVNGLAEEGADALGWVEVNVITDDPALILKAQKIFEDLWESSELMKISPAALKRAKAAYNNRQPKSGTSNAKTLLAACKENPAILNNVLVAAYTENLGPKAQKKMVELRHGAAASKTNLKSEDFKGAWGYQFGQETPKDNWILDLNCIAPGKERVGGCAQVTGLVMKVTGEDDLLIALRGVVRSKDGRRLPISAKEKALLIANAGKIIKMSDDKFIPLPTVMRRIG